MAEVLTGGAPDIFHDERLTVVIHGQNSAAPPTHTHTHTHIPPAGRPSRPQDNVDQLGIDLLREDPRALVLLQVPFDPQHPMAARL